MKRCQHPPEPTALAAYRRAQPQGTWEQMRADPHEGGQEAYSAIKQTLVRAQRGLCAYCEMRIADGLDPAAIDRRRDQQRIEHFHPKQDRSAGANWALNWANLWVVCLGGSQSPPAGLPADPAHYLPPLPTNLSCDAFKEHQIATGKLPLAPAGWLLMPDAVPAVPSLFQFAPDGTPEPGAQCNEVTIAPDNYADTTKLVAKTIEHLNLGCPRLNHQRRIVRAQLEKRIAQARTMAPGASPQAVLLDVARKLFAANANTPWPQFFTLIRWRLGEAAEIHLQSIHYPD